MVLIVGDPRAEWVEGMRRALAGALDPRVHVEVSAQASPHELQASLERLRGDASLNLAAVEFPAPSHVRIRLRAAHAAQPASRELSFGSSDVETERGRAIGFLISSMVPELRAPVPTATAPPPKPKPAAPAKASPPVVPEEHASEPPPAPPEEPSPPPATAELKPPPPPVEEPPPPPIAEPPPAQTTQTTQTQILPPPVEPPPWRRWSLELGGLGTWGAGRTSPDGGGTLAAQLFFNRLVIRLGATLTGGALPEDSASTTTFGPAAGVGYLILDDRFQLGVRLDLAAVYFAVSRESERHDRWEFIMRPRLDAAFTISGLFAVFAALGADVGFSSTKVQVREQTTELAPVAGALELGFRLSF
jgi:hypothetical protein